MPPDPAKARSLPDRLGRVTLKALPVGARFAYRGEVWRVRHNGSYVDVEAEQFSNHLTFYDSVTARKSGDLSWGITVVPIGSPPPSDETLAPNGEETV